MWRKKDNMKEKVKFQIGSRVFFGEYPDFESKDNDWLYIMEGWDDEHTTMFNFRKDGMDRFFMKDMSKAEAIEDTVKCKLPMRAGKFLVPDFAEYLGMTIDDLKRLEPVFDKIDDKHSYEKLIYAFYVENNAFTLTDEQRKEAYDSYKQSRIKK